MVKSPWFRCARTGRAASSAVPIAFRANGARRVNMDRLILRKNVVRLENRRQRLASQTGRRVGALSDSYTYRARRGHFVTIEINFSYEKVESTKRPASYLSACGDLAAQA